jgi:hypothetical protein
MISALGTALIMLLPLGFVTVQFWSANSAKSDTITAERRGVEYLRPALTLVGTLTAAQSAVLRGDTPNLNALSGAERDLDLVDALDGQALGTSTRWDQLHGQIDQLIKQPSTGIAAFQAYSNVIDLAVGLVGVVGGSAQLEFDGARDSHYLVNTVVLEMPELLTDVGRYTDLMTLTPKVPPNERLVLGAQAAVARDRIGQIASQIDHGITESLGTASTIDLGPGLLNNVDDFQHSVSMVAPLVQLAQSAQPLPDPVALRPLREQVDRAATDLGSASLDEVDSLLVQRAQAITLADILVIVAVSLGAVIAGYVFWRLAPGSREDRRLGTPRDNGRDDYDEDELRLLDRQGAGNVEVDPHDLIDLGEMIRVGRAVHRASREPDNDLH